jgi:hypothetical protein
MDDIYTVSVASPLHQHTFRDIEASSTDEASSIAAGWFFLEYPGQTDVRIVSANLQENDDANYTPYGVASSAAADSNYTAYGAVSPPLDDASYTSYTTYSSVISDSVATTAGFTTTLPVAPVLETSYHQTLTNGYAPYRSFRVKLPR